MLQRVSVMNPSKVDVVASVTLEQDSFTRKKLKIYRVNETFRFLDIYVQFLGQDIPDCGGYCLPLNPNLCKILFCIDARYKSECILYTDGKRFKIESREGIVLITCGSDRNSIEVKLSDDAFARLLNLLFIEAALTDNSGSLEDNLSAAINTYYYKDADMTLFEENTGMVIEEIKGQRLLTSDQKVILRTLMTRPLHECLKMLTLPHYLYYEGKIEKEEESEEEK